MPSLRLHPVHVRHETLSPLPWCGERAGTCLHKVAADEVPAVVWTKPSRLQLKCDTDDPVPIIEVPLLLAEVKQDWDSTSKQMVVIVKTWCEAEQTARVDEINFETLKSHATAAACSNKAAAHIGQNIDGRCEWPEFWIFFG